jgi:predicted ATPase
LDWSFGLLSEFERLVLRRLAVFVGHFSIEAALAVMTSASVDDALVFGAIDSLVAKSMVATRPAGASMRYRLLDTTRAYALRLEIDDAELTNSLHVTRRIICDGWKRRDRMADFVKRGATVAAPRWPRECASGSGLVLRT